MAKRAGHRFNLSVVEWVVISAVVLSTLIVLYGVTKYSPSVDADVATAGRLRVLAQCVESYYLDHGTIVPQGSWASALRVDQGVLRDGWGEPIRYHSRATSEGHIVTFTSAGPDRTDDGGVGDDVIIAVTPTALR